MKLRVYGVRGSIPTPGPTTVRYGGNTTCLSVRTDEELIILDGGSGIRVLGQELMAELPVTCSVFISHTHWDHIQGLPFFLPFFVPGNTVNIFGAFDPIYQKDLRTILSAQMEYCYFPVRSSELKAEISYSDLAERQEIAVGNVRVTPILMNHPVLTYGYRIDADGKRIFFTGDHEPPQNIYNRGDEGYEEYEKLIIARRDLLREFISGADVLVADSQYTEQEYQSKVGWGHGTFQSCIDLAISAGVSQLLFTHHDPTRTDDALDKIMERLSEEISLPESLKIGMATEGLEIEL